MINILDTLDFLTSVEERRGETVVVLGPMSCGKSFYIARVYDQIKKQAQRNVLAVKNDIDLNGSPNEIVSKGLNGDVITTPCVKVPISNPEELISTVRKYISENNKLDALIGDEIHFYKESMIPVLSRLRREYPDLYIILFGVDLVFRGEPFEIVDWTEANFCDHLVKLTSKCKFLNARGEQCSKIARNTVRLINDKDDAYSGNFDYVSRFFDPKGELISGHFRYAPFFDPTYVANVIDKKETEKARVYVPACPTHFKAPYTDETLQVHQYIVDNFIKNNSSVSLDQILISMENIPFLHKILQFLTVERGVYFDSSNFNLEQKFRGPYLGQYFSKPRTGNEGVYVPKK